MLSIGSGSNVALDMFPQSLEKGGLAEWIQTKPVGAVWDTEEHPIASCASPIRMAT
jgi:hypothetical protein